MDYLNIAMNKANLLGVDYADIRIQKTSSESIFLKNLSLKNTSTNVVHGYGIRILKNGAWGFAHSNIFTKDAVIKTTEKAYAIALNSAKIKNGKGITLAHERSYIDTFKTPIKIDPFEIPIKEKVDLLLEASKTMLNYDKIKQTMAFIQSHKDEKFFASTIGTKLDITTSFISPMINATAVTDLDSQSRSFNPGGIGKGWDFILDSNLLKKAAVV
ncbi:MAG: DNA gyrase modulator, partial [Candidatus Cloacimonadota bacterium]|nr:DNA gyrase modulator [Candidatus Cloacimonadota bacterium]